MNKLPQRTGVLREKREQAADRRAEFWVTRFTLRIRQSMRSLYRRPVYVWPALGGG